MLLEREPLLAQLHAQWTSACAGPGRLVFIEGEAGIGKTTLLRSFAQSLQGRAPVYWGGCEALLVQRALGPLEDIALQTDGALKTQLAGGAPRHRLFVAFVDLLAEQPCLAVLEDLHWADEGTLDLLRYAGRRIARTRSLLVASYRSDELVPAHPLRAVLGDLATSGALRLSPLSLSPAAVARLCSERGAAIDAAQLHRMTDGNPFFVTEVLASGHLQGTPATVQDAVLARAARLSPAGRAALDAAAVAGPRVEPWLLQALTAAHSGSAIDECLSTGVLRADDSAAFSFRHELARQAVLQALTPTRAMSLHRLVLQALLAQDGTQGSAQGNTHAARLALHADGAADSEAARRCAVEAARSAAAQGAHRQAAAHWALALKHTPRDAERAPLLDAHAAECRTCGLLEDALAAVHEAAGLWRRLGDPSHEAMSLANRALWLLAGARQDEGRAAITQALALVASADAEPAACVFVKRRAAAMHLMNSDTDAALALARDVLHTADRLADSASIAQARIVIGVTLLTTGRSDEGVDHLQRALADAEAQHDDQLIASTLLNLGSGFAEIHRLDLAEHWLLRGIAFCGERDIDMSRLYQLAWLAVVRLHQGRWDEAAACAQEVLADARAAAVARITALTALGRLHARRGEPGAWALLDPARALAVATGSLQRLAPVHAARAEAAWLEGRISDSAREAAAVLPLALTKRVPTFAAELLLWCCRGGVEDVAIPDFCAAHPFALEARGQWQAAAHEWTQRQCLYEAACAQAAGDDEPALREALSVFERWGATPMAERLRRRLRRAGVRGLARGPRASTRQHPAGLTAREVAVLTLLASGLRNKEIAERLCRSARTVDHHLASIFAKLGVATRAEAVSAAYRLGVLTAAPSRP